jgi:hypothetical protein
MTCGSTVPISEDGMIRNAFNRFAASLILALLVTPWACQSRGLPPQDAPNEPAPSQSGTSPSPERSGDFVKNATEITSAQIQMAHLAEGKAQSSAVRALANIVSRDYSDALVRFQQFDATAERVTPQAVNIPRVGSDESTAGRNVGSSKPSGALESQSDVGLPPVDSGHQQILSQLSAYPPLSSTANILAQR